MPIFLGHILKIVTQVVLLPIAQKAVELFLRKMEEHDKKVKAEENKPK